MTSTGSSYEVLYEFLAEGPEELSVKAGDVVVGIRECRPNAAS
jgi:ribosomal protein S17